MGNFKFKEGDIIKSRIDNDYHGLCITRLVSHIDVGNYYKVYDWYTGNERHI